MAEPPDHGNSPCGYTPVPRTLLESAGGLLLLLQHKEIEAHQRAVDCRKTKQLTGILLFLWWSFVYWDTRSPLAMGFLVGVALWMQYQWKWGWNRHMDEAVQWHQKAHDAEATYAIFFEQYPTLRHWYPNQKSDTHSSR